MDSGEAYRKFVCAGMPVTFAEHGKVSIISAFKRYFDVEAGQQVVLIGVGPWYELWCQDDWLNGNDKDI
jgi:hypothetical protein